MSAPKRILIIKLSALGDILHAIPAYSSLRAAFPDAQIDWLVEEKNKFLVSHVNGIDDIISINTALIKDNPLRLTAWLALWHAIRRLRKKRYDFCIDFQGLLKTAAISLLCGARVRVGFSKELVREHPAQWFYNRRLERPTEQKHVVDLNLLLAGAAGGRGATAAAFELSVPQQDSLAVDSLLKRESLNEFVVINPGGGWPTKRWQPAKYAMLAARIQQELHLPVVITTGPGEERLRDEIAQNCPEAGFLYFQLSFIQLIPLFRRAKLLIGGDTGPLHLASALGTPVVGIFGPTAPARNGPWSSGDKVVVHELPCSYCYGRTCPTQNECMDISVEEVFQSVVSRLGWTRN